MHSSLTLPCARVAAIFLAAALGAAPPDAAAEDRRFAIGLGLGKTSHIGVYDEYAAPLVEDWLEDLFGGGSGGGGAGGSDGEGAAGGLYDLAPNGIPDDFSWRLGRKPALFGWIEAELPELELPGGRIPLLRASVMYDENRLDLAAPSGFGILTDPTWATLEAEILAGGLELSVPALRWGAEDRAWEMRLGAGATAFYSRTRLDIRSAFLQIDERETRWRVQPLFTWALSRQVSDTVSAEFGMRLHPTDYFWTYGLNFGAKVWF
ncbi:hypothetical protein ACQ5SO_10360 [Rhodovulum sp. DZ06]|uniref:hypothetical protein n=1 Tax=Rhodovulum sp. DZ06 TaxID=3425126 RepID=UPI003D350786